MEGRAGLKSVLFISGSLGLGHITRDLAIARELRRRNPVVDISWLACPPASDLLKEAGEKLLPEADRWDDENLVAERISSKGEFHLNLVRWSLSMLKVLAHRALLFRKVIRREPFDLIIGDEAYEIFMALAIEHRLKTAPVVPILDYFGWEATSKNPLEKLGIYYWNSVWVFTYQHMPRPLEPTVFVGEEEDIPDRGFGFLLPNRKALAKKNSVIPVGYILDFNPEDYKDKERLRARLGYGREPLVIGSIGGTAIGKELLELCGHAYPIVKDAIPDLRMVLVCGPRLPTTSLTVPEGVEVRGYVPELYEHLAACDLAIVQGGGTTTLELTALRRPFIFFPLEGHFEQEICMANRLARHGAGIKLSFSQTTPQILAQHIISNIGTEATWPSIPIDGAQKAAQIINEILEPHGL